MLYKIAYNSQRDNFTFKNLFRAFWQCFSTCVWMFLSLFVIKIDAQDDKGLSEYLDDVEDSVGKPGIGEKVKRKYSWITGKTSYWWLVQEAGINHWLIKNGARRKVKFSDKKTPFEDLKRLIYGSPIIVHTKKLGGLRGGHIILIIGIDDKGFICHDPFGDATSGYAIKNGSAVSYPFDYLIKYTGKKVRCIYVEE